MRRAISLLLILLWPLLAQADTLVGRVVKITDGDTVTVLDARQTRTRSACPGAMPRSPTSPLASAPRSTSAAWPRIAFR